MTAATFAPGTLLVVSSHAWKETLLLPYHSLSLNLTKYTTNSQTNGQSSRQLDNEYKLLFFIRGSVTEVFYPLGPEFYYGQTHAETGTHRNTDRLLLILVFAPALRASLWLSTLNKRVDSKHLPPKQIIHGNLSLYKVPLWRMEPFFPKGRSIIRTMVFKHILLRMHQMMAFTQIMAILRHLR